MMQVNWPAGWPVVPVFAVMYFIRIPLEERMMSDRFGDAYREYARRSGRLVPRFKRESRPADSEIQK